MCCNGSMAFIMFSRMRRISERKRGLSDMIYSVLTVGLSDELVATLQTLIIQYDLNFTISLTAREANRLLERQIFHLLIIGLDYLRMIQQADWLTDIRHISFVPLIVLSNTPEQDVNNMVQLGADMCVSGKPPFAAIANHACAQLRRYTEYNHYNDPVRAETSPFQMGDIFIDPARRIVVVHCPYHRRKDNYHETLFIFPRQVHISGKAGRHPESRGGGFFLFDRKRAFL